jgi:putative spermidine/putrescine transport system permease protein
LVLFFKKERALKSLPRLDRYWLLLVPVVILLGVFYLYPLVRVLLLSVTDPALGVGNFERLVIHSGPRRVMFNTFRICAITTVISVSVAYLLACVMVHAPPRRRRIMLALVLLTLWISVLVRAFAWLILLDDNGVVNNALRSLGLISQPLALVRNETGVLIGMVHYLLPYAVLPLIAAMQAIDPALIRASHSLGAGRVRTFLSIFVPLTLPGIAAAAVIVFVFSLGFFITPSILGGGRVVMLAEYVSVTVLEELRWGFAAAQAVVLLVLTFLVLGVAGRLLGARRILPS